MTLTFELYQDSRQCQGPPASQIFRSAQKTLSDHEDKQTHAHARPSALPGPLKWPVKHFYAYARRPEYIISLACDGNVAHTF